MSSRDTHDPDDFSWAIPMMRAGYAGRGLVYVVVSLFTLWAIWQGGGGTGGTTTYFQRLESTSFGGIVLGLIVIGMFAYAVWRLSDAFWDLEDYGSDGKGLISRAGMIVTGAIHAALGVAAASILMGSGSGGGGQGGQSGVARAVSNVLAMPGGQWLVGIAGVLTVCAGVYYLIKAWKQSYRQHLRANEFTMNWNTALRAGVAAQGVIVTIIGVFIVIAGFQADASEAGGLGQTFSWLGSQTYGQILVSALALGLLGFALFCFVNAGYRIVPKATDDNKVESMTRAVKRKAQQHA